MHISETVSPPDWSPRERVESPPGAAWLRVRLRRAWMCLSPAQRDALAVIVIAAGVYATAARFDLAEGFFDFARRHEAWQIDEAASALGVLSFVMAAYAVRRWREAVLALRRQRQLEARLHHQAFTDSLTGLTNRALFRDRVTRALVRRQRTGEAVVILYVDLDGFKRVNDSMGHAAGDDLLVTVARRLQTCLREMDTVARLGGDEFGILLEDQQSAESAEAVAERVLQALAEPVALRVQEVRVSGSLGIADAQAGTTAEILMRNGDLAMYAAKQRGGRTWVRYREEMHSALLVQMAREQALREAVLDRCPSDQFHVQYQPIVDVASGRLSGLEALARWRHPVLGTVAPSDFIPLAETSGLIGPLGRWVLREACRQMREWDRTPGAAPIPSISVNVSVVQLEAPGFEAEVLDALREFGLAPTRLVLEVTESLMVSAKLQILSAIENLRSIGVRFAVDDFGTGYSSLSYLNSLPVDVIKIDRSFVAGLDRGDQDSAVARSVIALARSLRLHVVAEGVETDEQLGWLRREGCDLAQGFVFARPMVAAEVERFRTCRPGDDVTLRN